MFQSEKTSYGVSKQKSEVQFGLSRIQTCALWVKVYRGMGEMTKEQGEYGLAKL